MKRVSEGGSRSASLFVGGVLPVVRAVLLHLEPLAIVDLGLHRDVVAPLALGAFEGDLDPLIVLRHDALLSLSTLELITT